LAAESASRLDRRGILYQSRRRRIRKAERKRVLAGMQASEKVYADFQFETRNPGGHSSVPGAENAIYELAAALLKVQSYSFPLRSTRSRAIILRMPPRSHRTIGRRSPRRRKGTSRSGLDQAAIEYPYTTRCCTPLASPRCSPAATRQTRSRKWRAPTSIAASSRRDPEHVRKALERTAADPKLSITAVVQKTADGQVIPIVTVPPSRCSRK